MRYHGKDIIGEDLENEADCDIIGNVLSAVSFKTPAEITWIIAKFLCNGGNKRSALSIDVFCKRW